MDDKSTPTSPLSMSAPYIPTLSPPTMAPRTSSLQEVSLTTPYVPEASSPPPLLQTEHANSDSNSNSITSSTPIHAQAPSHDGADTVTQSTLTTNAQISPTTSTTDNVFLDKDGMGKALYYHLFEQQNVKSKLFGFLRNPLPSIIIAYLIMALVVVCPLYQQTNYLSINNLTYLLVYIPIVAVFCFAVFFSLTYCFLNLSRVPENANVILFLFAFVWVSIQIGVHVLSMAGHIFPVPFEWIIVSFGFGVPLIYLIVWASMPAHLRRNPFRRPTIQWDDPKAIPMPQLTATQSSPIISDSATSLDNVSISSQHSSTDSIGLSDKSAASSNSTSSSSSISSSDMAQAAINKAAAAAFEITVKEQSATQTPKTTFLFRFWVVASTLFLGPFGYCFFHLFLLAFYSVTSNLFQSLLIVGFQVLIVLYKLIFRLSFHRMRFHLPYIPIRVFQDGRILFLFWLELSSHCFFSMVFPHVGSWYMILLYLIVEAISLTLQVVADTSSVRSLLIRMFESVYSIFSDKPYKGYMVYNILGQSGELDRTVSLELFFFNCVARSLAGFSYIVFSLVIYFGPNKKFYQTIDSLDADAYNLTLVYATASIVSSFVQLIVFRVILKRVYRIDLVRQGYRVWKRKPDVAFFFITNCFILPLVVLLQHNNAVSYLLSVKL
ncbi:hypothetical protein SAMD00019534_089360 [Acytostelium subglobosum LB1]|uniref:hypothetical protein n=1 Tax=Acytostelium subglobosum LB1 TaxID=1410327 RepID=UPI000644E616|nr:hypothetical protein SAMD00019534_089360 [Acytostelium subglobosum LB1]GAM25761.1 hypothetical protein SAMD00019534_089360 [Acytostelium subglobosum LB1]|eukprot:XP_012751279.1 hypothetical protein SAMD00019534_089360 [Acytostelium subglobosum LB1]